MEATLRDSLSNLSRNAEEYAYHLEHSTSFMENQIVWGSRQQDIPRTIPKTLIFCGPQRNPNEPLRPLYNKDLFFLKYGNTKEKKYILSLHKIYAEEFPEPDLEEKLNQWVRKEFKNFNEDARLSIQHWKLDFMEQIMVMRANDKTDSFSEADFKYLNKKDIEDLYYLCRSKEIDNQKVKLMNSLITFIRSCVIWERVHDFQLGIESYQMKVNLTAPTLTFPGIKEHAPYTIVDEPRMGLIYLNSKDEKRVMYLEEIVKFCDATLEKVLNEVKLRMFESKFLKKPPLLGELDQDIMKAYEREISKRLSHRQQMRRWESFVNGRPILPTMKRLLADGTKSYPIGIVRDVEVCQEEAPYWTTLGKRESYKSQTSSDGVGARTPYYARKDFLDCHLLGEWEIARDAKINPFKDVLVFRRMVEFLGAIPINLKINMWESKDLIKSPIN
ncbi:hypothetical protein Tco_0123830 [Tanacetum coccineum]